MPTDQVGVRGDSTAGGSKQAAASCNTVTSQREDSEGGTKEEGLACLPPCLLSFSNSSAGPPLSSPAPHPHLLPCSCLPPQPSCAAFPASVLHPSPTPSPPAHPPPAPPLRLTHSRPSSSSAPFAPLPAAGFAVASCLPPCTCLMLLLTIARRCFNGAHCRDMAGRETAGAERQ